MDSKRHPYLFSKRREREHPKHMMLLYVLMKDLTDGKITEEQLSVLLLLSIPPRNSIGRPSRVNLANDPLCLANSIVSDMGLC